MTNALILGMLSMVALSHGVDHERWFWGMWVVAILFNTFAGEKWR